MIIDYFESGERYYLDVETARAIMTKFRKILYEKGRLYDYVICAEFYPEQFTMYNGIFNPKYYDLEDSWKEAITSHCCREISPQLPFLQITNSNIHDDFNEYVFLPFTDKCYKDNSIYFKSDDFMTKEGKFYKIYGFFTEAHNNPIYCFVIEGKQNFPFCEELVTAARKFMYL